MSVSVGLTAAVKSRRTLVFHHLWNARHAARLCRDREADLSSLKCRLPEVELNGTAMVAVMSSVAFLEALVNEVYLGAVDPQTSPDRLKGITDDAIAAMRDRWNATPSVEREGVPEKYKIALECAGKKMELGPRPRSEREDSCRTAGRPHPLQTGVARRRHRTVRRVAEKATCQ